MTRHASGWMTGIGCLAAVAVLASAADARPADAPAPARPTGAAVATAPAAAQDPAPAQDAAAADPPSFWKSIEVTGFVDGYYGWAFNEEPPQLRNFDVNHNEFSLNLIEVAVEKKVSDTSRAGFRVDFNAGQTADLVNAFEPGGPDFMKHVQQAYASYLVPVGKGLQVDFGKFVTPAGAEVIETRDNWNYSRGLLFALAVPYYHAGFRVAYPVTDKVSVTGYLVNGWNNVRDNNAAKTVGASVSVKPTDRITFIQNYLVGDEQNEDGAVRNLFDSVLSVSLTDKLSVLGNFDYGRDEFDGETVDWVGWAGALRYQATERFAFSPRFEWLSDGSRLVTGGAERVSSITATAEYRIGDFITRTEFRTDFASEEFFVKGEGFEKTQPTLTFGIIYAFSSSK